MRLPEGKTISARGCSAGVVIALALMLLVACDGNPVFVEVEEDGPGPDETAILFIGNSITLWFDMVEQFKALADSAGHPVWVIDLSKLGQRLENHLEFAVTDVKIAEWEWDYVVLQEANYAVAFPDYHYLMDPEFAHFRDLIRSEHPDCGIVMTMDYAVEQVTLLDTLFTFEELQPRITAGTILFADRYDFIVAPVGTAFDTVRAERPGVPLLDADQRHPSEPMAYLQACIYFATFFRESPVGIPYYGTIDTELALWLQGVAARTVLTDPGQWNLPDTP
jgi:hypothetical protein